jgi:hypothetical protein
MPKLRMSYIDDNGAARYGRRGRARCGWVWQGMAGRAGQGRARYGRQGKVRRGLAWWGKARQGWLGKVWLR